MNQLNQRVQKGVEYFRELKPSDFVITGMVNPKRWREFTEFLDLVKSSVNGGQEVLIEEDEDGQA